MIHQDDDYEIDSNKKKIKLDSKGVQRQFEQNLGGKRPPLHLPSVPGQSLRDWLIRLKSNINEKITVQNDRIKKSKSPLHLGFVQNQSQNAIDSKS